jgi:hypothetical protein
MATADLTNIDDVLETRLEILKGVLGSFDFSGLSFGPINYLKHQLTEGRLRGLRFDRALEPQDAMDYLINQTDRAFLLSKRARLAMHILAQERSLTDREIDWMVDNFYIHELLHFAQGMGGGNHSLLRAQAPQVLLAIDYQADAIAVVTATVLAWCKPEFYGYAEPQPKDNHWTLYVEAIKAVLRQMDIFTLLARHDMDRSKIAAEPSTVERIQRIATWHYQLHRAQLFNPQRPLADFQILSQPILDFRHLAAVGVLKPAALTHEWPVKEREIIASLRAGTAAAGFPIGFEERAPLIVTGATPHGTTRFVRHTPAHNGQYADAFRGIFFADPDLSRELFTTLLELNPWLTGYDQPPPGGGPDGPDGDMPTSPAPGLLDLTGSLAIGARETDRLDILASLLKHSQFPLVVMAV